MKSLKTSIVSTLLLFIVSFLLVSCASGPRQEDYLPYGESHTSDASPQEAGAFQDIDRYYKEKKFDDVLKKSKSFISKYPKSPILDQVYFLRGLSYLSQGQQQHALINFKHVTVVTTNEIIRSMASFNKALIEYELQQLKEARGSLEGVNPSAISDKDKFKYYILLSKVERDRNENLGSVRAVLFALRYLDPSNPTSTQEASSLFSFLENSLGKIDNIPHLEKLVEDFSDLQHIHYVYHRIGQLAISVADLTTARAYYGKIVADFTQSKFYPEARDFVARSVQTSRSDARKVGVLLSLSGKFGKYGYKSLQGIQLAFDIFKGKNAAVGSRNLSLVVADDKGEEDAAVKALEDLVLKHEVVAVIGPLLSKLADPVAKRAEELGVTLITLTQKEAFGGSYVFNASLTPSMQIRELLRVTQEMGQIKKFAVLSPNSKFGEEYSKNFWDEVIAQDGEIRGAETYPPEETDFRSYIDGLVGLTYPDARGPEVAELNELKAASQLKVSNKKLNKMFSLKPFVDFEAVFIPDEPKSLGQILPTFAYRDVEKVLFLGINTWNSPELLSRAGQYAEGSIFVDAYYPGSEIPSAKYFEQRFLETFGAAPSSMEATSYDAAQIVATLLSEGGISSRNDLRDRLLSLKDFPGVMGKISYSNGKLTKRLAVLTVKGGKIEEVAVK